VLHKLRVYKIKLEVQNEELGRWQVELAAAQASYFDPYNLAPVGYCTVSEKGLVVHARLAACWSAGPMRMPMRRY